MAFNLWIVELLNELWKKFYQYFYIFLPLLLTILYFGGRSIDWESSNKGIADVIIVGSGFSGVGAASSLYENGIKNFLVLEAKNFKGGRVHQEQFAGVTVSLGAGWVHWIEKEGLIWRLVKKHNIKHFYEDYNHVTYKEPGVEIDLKEKWEQTGDILESKLNDVMKLMKTYDGDLSLAEALEKVGWKAKTRIEKAAEYFAIDFENGSPPEILSGKYFHFSGEGTDVVITDSKGYESLTDIIAQPFKDKIKLNHQVESVTRVKNNYLVRTSNGETFHSKYVMLSVSHRVLQHSKIKIDPPLPKWKINSFNKLITGEYCKIFLHYPYKFWERTNYIIIGQNTKEFKHWQNLEQIFPGKNILMATLTGEECKQSEQESDDIIKQKSHEALKKVYGDIPSPIGFLRSKWGIDPHILGAYSNPTKGTTLEDVDIIRKSVFDDTLWFTGEHTGDFSRSGYVDGALNIGMESGNELAKLINQRNSQAL